MLEGLLGSTNAERVLMFIAIRGQGYGREIAKTFDVGPSMIQKQLDRMERDGLLVSKTVGRTRVYEFNPRFAFKDEVQALMEKALSMYPSDVRDEIKYNRRRPRKKGKEL